MPRAGQASSASAPSTLPTRLAQRRQRLHVTDATNASRTMLYDIAPGHWDDRLIERLSVPRAVLPELRDSQDDFGIAAG